MNPSSCRLNQLACCAGKGCLNHGNICLRVQVLNKTGYFCDSCARELLYLDLVTQEKGDNDNVNTQSLRITKGERPLESDSRVSRPNHSIAYTTIKVIRDSWRIYHIPRILKFLLAQRAPQTRSKILNYTCALIEFVESAVTITISVPPLMT